MFDTVRLDGGGGGGGGLGQPLGGGGPGDGLVLPTRIPVRETVR